MSIQEIENGIFLTSVLNDLIKVHVDCKDIDKSYLEIISSRGCCTYSSIVWDGTYFSKNGDSSLALSHFTKSNDSLSSPYKSIYCPISWDFTSDLNNNLYCACWGVITPVGGLYRYKNGKVESISEQANIESKAIWCLYYDKNSNILWVGSLDKGLYKLYVNEETLFLKPDYFGLKDFAPKDVYNDRYNSTWIGAEGYIIKLKPDLTFKIIGKKELFDKIESYQKSLNQYNNSQTSFMHSKKAREGFIVYNFSEDTSNGIWIGTSWGIIKLDNNLKVTNFLWSPEAGGHIALDKNGKLIYSEMYKDLHIFPNNEDLSKSFDFSVKQSSTPKDIVKIISSPTQIWYASYTNGIYKSIDTNLYSINSTSCFKVSSIKDLMIDSKENLLIGANNGNIYIAAPKGDTLDILNNYKPDGLLYGSSISFVNEYNGNYIIGTNKGINIIKGKQFIKLIGQSEGLIDIGVNNAVKDKSGNLYIGTNTGLIRIELNQLIRSPSQQYNPVAINEIKVNQQSFKSIDSLLRWNNFGDSVINLNYTQNDIEIIFSQNNISSGAKNLYRYKVAGLSERWSEYESIGRIQLRAIPYGSYKLIMEGKNIGTGENIPARVVTLIITPPIWQSTFFLIFMALLLSFCGYLLYTWRIGVIAVRAKEKAELTNIALRSRLEALRAQMNPHFTFNAINSIQNFIIDKDAEQALLYLSEFSKLIRQTLDNSSEKMIALETEVSFLKSYIKIQKIRFEKIQTSILLDKVIDPYSLLIPPLIIQPFVENAFEHAFDELTDKNSIQITFTVEDSLLICRIEDNGKGYNVGSKNNLHESKGIQLTRDRLQLLNREYNTNQFSLSITNISDTQSDKHGTLVTISLPIITFKSEAISKSSQRFNLTNNIDFYTVA